jgi:hypothetical protein
MVVARRWDQLGGRLSAIVNARAIAELFELDFRFVWPRGRDDATDNPLEIFSRGFLDAFGIQPSELAGREVVPHHELVPLARLDGRRKLEHAGTGAFVDVNEIFEVIGGPSESVAQARERYRRSFHQIDWNADVRRLIGLCSRWPTGAGIPAIHVRAGDVVDGNWRHVVVHEKYSPTPFVHHAIERLTQGGKRQVLVLSDSSQYLAWLKDRFRGVISTAEIVPGYERLTEMQQALADILILSRCQLVVGPPSSAFSRLAANLGPGELVRADKLVAEGEERSVLLAGIAEHRSRGADSLWAALVARDICWCLDVFSDALSLREQRELARQAVDLDPDFSGAHTRLARVATLACDWQAARGAGTRGLEIAQSAKHHDDPLVEALATDISVKCFAALGRRLGFRARSRSESTATTLEEVRRTFGRCSELHPFWLDRERVLGDLEFLISIVERLSEETNGLRRKVARSLARAKDDELDLPDLRPSGLERHRRVAMYDPLTRDLDRMALRLYRAVRSAGLSTDPPRLALAPHRS